MLRPYMVSHLGGLGGFYPPEKINADGRVGKRMLAERPNNERAALRAALSLLA